ncbi:hypothetical protein EDB89DRAFT_2231771 [Lactarius sanguifluus]|nr:hypothetical protein EDB89DRAFT_2231771 [Lactarius sanguifluus]
MTLRSSQKKPNLPLKGSMHPIFVAQDNEANLALAWHSKASRRGAHPLSQVSAAQPTARRSNDDSEQTQEASVGSGKMKGHGIRTLRKVADEADAVLLVLDAHDTNRGRGNLVEEQVYNLSIFNTTREFTKTLALVS